VALVVRTKIRWGSRAGSGEERAGWDDVVACRSCTRCDKHACRSGWRGSLAIFLAECWDFVRRGLDRDDGVMCDRGGRWNSGGGSRSREGLCGGGIAIVGLGG